MMREAMTEVSTFEKSRYQWHHARTRAVDLNPNDLEAILKLKHEDQNWYHARTGHQAVGWKLSFVDSEGGKIDILDIFELQREELAEQQERAAKVLLALTRPGA